MGVVKEQYNIIIVGGGIVGLTLALLLAQSDKRIALIEKRAKIESFNRAQYDVRVSAVTPASVKLFEQLSVWKDMVALRVSPFTHMHVWDGDGRGKIEFDAASAGVNQLGYIVENNVMLQALWQRVASTAQIEVLSDIELEYLERHENNPNIELHGGDRILTAPLVIGADGAQSWLRQAAHIAMTERDYQHHALVCTVKTEKAHDKTARQRFMTEGPLAFLPLDAAHYSSIVWSSAPTHIDALMQLSDEGFALALTDAFQSQLGAVIEVGPRARFPLIMRHAQHYVQAGLALVGDAAHTVHPLAGQGLNLGLADAALLAELVLEEYAHKNEYVKYSTLRRYERARKTENATMLAAMDGFKHLFGNDIPVIKWLRHRGLNLTDRSSFIKSLILQKAMGV
ncbi:MAG: ubiquinone biosynthesis protein UbiH [Gammaproteobacteria bacterium]|jgi:2-octaprenylphenol hydroxylase|nr:ubiquinone biosynthesis protein UbiH [Gammaproteobacteria bacterium]